MIYFSIVIPLYNKSLYIEKTLNSIKNQNYQNYEVIIVNDGSTDSSKEVVENFIEKLGVEIKSKFKLLNKNNSGVSSTRNYGIKYSNYDYIAFLDADDYWEENHLSNFVNLINEYSQEVDMFSNASKQQENKNFIFPKLSKYNNFIGVVDYFKVSLISNGFINSSSVCVKKEVMNLNLFPIEMKNFEDMITWARIANSKGFAFSSEQTSVYVIENAESSSHINFENYLKYEELLESIKYNYYLLKIYKLKFLLLHILFARMKMNLNTYIENSLKIFLKSYIVSFCLIIGLFFPKFILKILKDSRKTRK
jgi:glycosyltransferase involved in cell wall biosynthesis